CVFFQAEDGIRDRNVTGVQTCALPILQGNPLPARMLDLLNTERSSGINTDTLIVLRVPKNGDEPTAVSIPRDTWVTTPSGDKAKINSVFGKTKARTVEQLRAEEIGRAHV